MFCLLPINKPPCANRNGNRQSTNDNRHVNFHRFFATKYFVKKWGCHTKKSVWHPFMASTVSFNFPGIVSWLLVAATSTQLLSRFVATLGVYHFFSKKDNKIILFRLPCKLYTDMALFYIAMNNSSLFIVVL